VQGDLGIIAYRFPQPVRSYGTSIEAGPWSAGNPDTYCLAAGTHPKCWRVFSKSSVTGLWDASAIVVFIRYPNILWPCPVDAPDLLPPIFPLVMGGQYRALLWSILVRCYSIVSLPALSVIVGAMASVHCLQSVDYQQCKPAIMFNMLRWQPSLKAKFCLVCCHP